MTDEIISKIKGLKSDGRTLEQITDILYSEYGYKAGGPKSNLLILVDIVCMAQDKQIRWIGLP